MSNQDYYQKYIKYKQKYINLKSNDIILQTGGAKYILNYHTYKDYLKFAHDNNEKDCRWIYNIIDTNESTKLNKLLFSNENFVLVTENNMKNEDMSTFHLLAFPKDKTIRSIRDLKQDHISLLQEMSDTGKKYINDTYKININEIETHCHYPPGVMLLHIHFELINNIKCRKPLREHAVSRIIENLKLDSDYYKKITMEFIQKVNE